MVNNMHQQQKKRKQERQDVFKWYSISMVSELNWTPDYYFDSLFLYRARALPPNQLKELLSLNGGPIAKDMVSAMVD